MSSTARIPGAGAGRRRAPWDVALSVVLLVVTYLAYWIGTVFAFVSLSILAPCPDGVCGTAQAGGVQFVAALVIFLVGVVGTAVTILLFVLRRRAWWAAAATLALTVAGWFTAFGLYSAALTS